LLELLLKDADVEVLVDDKTRAAEEATELLKLASAMQDLHNLETPSSSSVAISVNVLPHLQL
jgi:hypothetical protein